MAYGTVADAQELYGEQAVARVCDRDADGVVDTASFERQLAVAEQIMNGYLLGRYPLPLEPTYLVPDVFTKYCCDIAMYNSALGADVRTTEMRQRYDDALAYMKLIAENKIKIPLATPEAPTEPVTEPNRSQLASVTGGRSITVTDPYRTFTPANTRRIL